MNNKFLLVALFAAWCLGFASCDKDKGNEPDNPTQGEQTGQSDSTEGEEDISKFETSISGTENGFDYVDLGLPSGLKWATCNVGADSPEEYGYYYAWGETTPKTIAYNWNTYKWATATYHTEYLDDKWALETLTKYNTSSDYGTVDNKTVLELADDAARVNWGGAWRMPTDAEWTELCERCTWTWINFNGINGYEVKSNINGYTIFLPGAGNYDYNGLGGAGDIGFYWSSSLNTDYPYDALDVYFSDSEIIHNILGRFDYRFRGRPVRPVLGE